VGEDDLMKARGRMMLAATAILIAATAYLARRGDAAFLRSGPEPEVSAEDGAVVVRWTHEIAAPMAATLAAVFAQWKDRSDRFVLVLDSPGGAVAEGRAVIEEIERLKKTHLVETRVEAGGVCASMCALIYFRGEHRSAAASARFMFHESSAYEFFTDEKVERPAFERQLHEERVFRRYFEATEIDPEWAGRLRAEWRGRDIWRTAEELVAEGSNVVEEIR
jgi:ATP-dependent protease ClpP protease subunit